MAFKAANVSRLAYVGRRLLHMIPVVLGVTIIAFFMIHLVPGDPARTLLGIRATDQAVAAFHHEWGLDRSLPAQYGLFIGRLFHGDLGDSLFYRVPTLGLILSHMPPTLWLLGYAIVLSVAIAVPLATLAATKKDSVRDHAIRAVPLVGLGMPSFWWTFSSSSSLSIPTSSLWAATARVSWGISAPCSCPASRSPLPSRPC